MMFHYGYFGPWMWVGGVIWILLLVGAAVLIYQLVRHLAPPATRLGPAADDPLAVLKIRYARGEITREQYIQMQKDITAREPPII